MRVSRGRAVNAIQRNRKKKRNNMHNRGFEYLVTGALLTTGIALAGPTPLPLRSESGTCLYHGGTTQTVEIVFGTNAVTLPFSATTAYDFFSPPLTAPTSLTTSDRASGFVVLDNSSSSAANDFNVTASMRYLDYNPAAGTESLIVVTDESSTTAVRHSKTAAWSLPKTYLTANATVPAGHLLHIALTVTLVSGNPGAFGRLVYNGAQNSTTIGLLPQNNGPASWGFGMPGASTLCVDRQADGCVRVGCTGVPGKTYLIQASTSLISPNWTTI